jgi:hypothetical protein
MSLINDALRRASQPQKINPNMPKLLSAQEPPPKSSGGGNGIKVVLLLAILAVGGWYGWGYWKKSHASNAEANATAAPAKAGTTNAVASTESKTNRNPIARAAATLSKWAERSSDQEPAKVEAKPDPARAAKAAANGAALTAAAAAPQGKPASSIPGMPKVQAIFYRPTDASAIISGQTVHNGDEIGGAKVIEIKRQSVRMLLNGDMHEVTIK